MRGLHIKFESLVWCGGKSGQPIIWTGGLGMGTVTARCMMGSTSPTSGFALHPATAYSEHIIHSNTTDTGSLKNTRRKFYCVTIDK
jgi:hypothetical protein